MEVRERGTDGGRIGARSTAGRIIAHETCTCRRPGVATKRLLGVLMARYTMRQQLVSIGEDFDIADEHGNPVYRVDGKALSLRETFVIEDLQGREVATIREKKLALRESMDVLRRDAKIATIRKARFAPFRDSFSIDVEGGQEMVAQGVSWTTSTTSSAGTRRSPAYRSTGSR
jgi:uncharacterized protein YxjI